jgi:predicted RNA-binding Zn-ribbon protein involved in translation (DUF1610 family)
MSELKTATGPVNAEIAADPSNELRTTDCSVCGEKNGITEKSIGRGLTTVILCSKCGYEYFKREP